MNRKPAGSGDFERRCERIHGAIEIGVKEGAKLLVDDGGQPGFQQRKFCRPNHSEQRDGRDERGTRRNIWAGAFGDARGSLEQAIALVNADRGHGTSIFTENGAPCANTAAASRSGWWA